MSVHLLKLCVGASTPQDLGHFQQRQYERYGRCFHTTRMYPKRADELCDGGSLYWVMAGQITVRQKIVEIERFIDPGGVNRCHIELDRELILTRLKSHRPFQGWRYLPPENAPEDLAANGGAVDDIPEAMRRELLELGLI